MSLQLVRFKLLGRSFALPAPAVREVLRIAEITPLPESPRFLEGVLNVRGEVLPVIDLRKRFGLPEAAYRYSTRIVVALLGRRAAGLIVDSVEGVVEVAPEEMGAAQTELLGRDLSRFVSRVVKDGGALLPVLDACRLLTEAEAEELEKAPGCGGGQ